MHFDKIRGQWVACVDTRINGIRHRKAKRLPKGTSEADARCVEERMNLEVLHSLKTFRDNHWEGYVADLLATKSWIDEALSKCIYRSKRRGLPCTITRQHIAQALLISNGRCQISGVKFCLDAVPGRSYRPYMHSIDRINAKEGYTVLNIRVVCAGVNMAMMHWGEEMFSQFAVGYVLNKYGFMSDLKAKS